MTHMRKYQNTQGGKRTRAKIKKERVLILLLLIVMVFFAGVGLRFMLIGRTLESEDNWVETLSRVEDHPYTNTMFVAVDGDNILKYVLIINHGNDEELNMLHIPGKTYLDTPGNEVETLMESYTWGGMDKLLSTVREHFSMNIHNGVKVHTDFFDTLAGELEFSHQVDLTQVGDDTNTSQLYAIIDFYRDLTDQVGLFNRPRVRSYVVSHLETNLNWEGLESLVHRLELSREQDELNFVTLPGEIQVVSDQESLIPNHEEVELLVNQYFAEEGTFELSHEEITVELLNGTGEPGVASKVEGILTAQGFEVVRTGNADHTDYKSSEVIARAQPTEAAKQVYLEIKRADYYVDLVEESDAMVTVIIGSHYLDKLEEEEQGNGDDAEEVNDNS